MKTASISGLAVHPESPSDAALWRDGARKVHLVRVRPADRTITPQDEQAAQEAAKARTRLNNLVARRLDAFQNETRYFWDRLNQWFATALCIGLFAWALNSVSGGSLTTLNLLLIAIPSGVAAPFAKDVTTALSSFGKKS